MMSYLFRTALNGFALWVMTLVVPGANFVGGNDTAGQLGIIFVVAALFGLVNAIKPILQVLSLPLLVLTLGLFSIVINAFLLWLTSQFTKVLGWGLTVEPFWWQAIFAAIVLSVVSWALAAVTSRN